MTYEKFINRPLAIYGKILHQVDNVRRLEDVCMKATSVLSERVQTSRENTLEKNYVALADAKRELADMIAELDVVSKEVRDFLYGNLNIDDADILEWKYINGKSNSEISKIQNLTYSGATTKISRAEKKAEEAYLRRYEKD